MPSTLGNTVWDLGFRVYIQGLGIRDLGLGLRVSVFGVSGLAVSGFKVWGSGLRA